MKCNYVWNETTIKEKLFDLTEKSRCEKLSANEKRIIEISIYSYENMLSSLTSEKKKNSTCNMKTLLSFYKDMQHIHRSLLMSENVINIISHISKINLKHCLPFKKISVTDEGMINISKEFYHSLDVDLYNIIIDTEEKNSNLYHFTAIDKNHQQLGEAFHDPYNDLTYIYIEKSNTFNDCFSLVHEDGHLLNYSSEFKSYGYTQQLVAEATPQLMEMLFAFLHNKDQVFKKEVHKIMQRNFNSIINCAKILNLQLKLFNIMDNMGEYGRKHIDCYHNIYSQFSKNELKLILNVENQYTNYIKYVFSYIIASTLFYQYLDNKKDAVSKIKHIILNYYSVHPVELFDDIGIDLYKVGNKIKDTKILIP